MTHRLGWGLFAAATLAGWAHADRPDPAAFMAERERIHILAVERLRSPGGNDPRVMVTAESSLKALHEEYQVKGGTPPVSLDGDLSELRGACRQARRLAQAGRPPAPHTGAPGLIDWEWESYRLAFEALIEQLKKDKADGRPESQLYWHGRRSLDTLQENVSRRLLYNPPPGETHLSAPLRRDEELLLITCETGPKKSRGENLKIILPVDHAPAKPVDAQPFYRSLDMVPESKPLRVGAFRVPVGARTVTLRDGNARLVVRTVSGEGVAYLGRTEETLGYRYLAIPPDTAWYFENTGSVPLELEYVGIKP